MTRITPDQAIELVDEDDGDAYTVERSGDFIHITWLDVRSDYTNEVVFQAKDAADLVDAILEAAGL